MLYYALIGMLTLIIWTLLSVLAGLFWGKAAALGSDEKP